MESSSVIMLVVLSIKSLRARLLEQGWGVRRKGNIDTNKLLG